MQENSNNVAMFQSKKDKTLEQCCEELKAEADNIQTCVTLLIRKDGNPTFWFIGCTMTEVFYIFEYFKSIILKGDFKIRK